MTVSELGNSLKRKKIYSQFVSSAMQKLALLQKSFRVNTHVRSNQICFHNKILNFQNAISIPSVRFSTLEKRSHPKEYLFTVIKPVKQQKEVNNSMRSIIDILSSGWFISSKRGI
jgi:hypothetical protein